MPRMVDNVGSTARDYCMLERNLLSYFKLALLLSLLSSSVLLKVRLPGPVEDSHAGVPMASIQILASLAALAVGLHSYWTDQKAMRNMRAFLMTQNSHLGILTLMLGLVITTAIVLLSTTKEL
ncbi:hypothetical protein FIBSPDRAFT_900149 [Athelia psychrophila]|uniref:DUF202 domain-containing protein n=1 Tax=Athelia psychrophila TaxID=1759441 RepID=A0A165YTM8_9AGAM|nr:hypothetical protein FIBSPDRAFT_900149 [Fibularhizoctonia sp. CBS 109695]